MQPRPGLYDSRGFETLRLLKVSLGLLRSGVEQPQGTPLRCYLFHEKKRAAAYIWPWRADLWRREFQNKNGANSKTTEYAANIQKADLEEALQARYLMCSVQFPAVALQL